MWRWYAGWGVLTMVGVVVSQILCGDHSLLLICVSGNTNCFLCYRWGLLVPCALEKYSEAPVVVTFSCGPRIFAEFWMVAFALCSATSFGVFYIFSAWGWMQEFTFLTCYAVSTRLFFVKITMCVDLSLPWPSFFVLRFIGCSCCCFPACGV